MSEDRSHLTPFALAVGAAAISFAAIFFRLAAPTHPLASAAIRLGIAACLLSPFVLRAAARGDLDKRFVSRGLLAGVFYAAHFGAWVWSLGLTTVAASVTLVTATPLLLAVWGLVTGTDRPNRRLVAALSLAACGIAIIGGGDLGSSRDALIGDALAFAGAAAIAGYMLVVRPLGAIDVFAFTGIAAAVGSAVLFVVGFASGVSMAPASGSALMFLALSALIPQLIGHSALTWSLRWTTPTAVGTATLAEPVGAAILAYFVLGETFGPTTAAGCLLTLAAVALALRSFRPAV